MRNAFKQDYYRMTGKQYHVGLDSWITCHFSHQIRYMKWWRRAKNRMNPFYRMLLKKYAMKYGLEISMNADIGKGLYLGHPYNITVGAGATLGDNVNFIKGVPLAVKIEENGREHLKLETTCRWASMQQW